MPETFAGCITSPQPLSGREGPESLPAECFIKSQIFSRTMIILNIQINQISSNAFAAGMVIKIPGDKLPGEE